MKKVTIIDYGSGNLHSLAKAVEKVAREVDFEVIVSSNSEDIKTASHIILPGVGAFGDCINGLDSLDGVREALTQAVINEKKPLLGVCVGMQMLADEGLEHGKHKGLGWIKGEVVPIKTSDPDLKIPHMGWNDLIVETDHPIFDGIKTGDHAYFVHSFYFKCKFPDNILAEVEYGDKITAAVASGNIVATQFHPEKSQEIGLRLLSNFLKLK